eukprot:jgi/Astpho2/303/Aster-02188
MAFNMAMQTYNKTHMDQITKRVLPFHTRDALFQCFCDLRSNRPKDREFFKQHLAALKPHTYKGWVAAIAAVLSTVAGASGLVIAATFVLGATLCSLVAVLVALGGTLGAVLTFLAFFTVISCMVTLAAAGSMAACAAFGYFVLSFCQAVFTFAARLMHSTAPTVQQRLADATGHSEPDAITPPQSSASGAGKPASLADVVSPWAPSGSGVNLPDAKQAKVVEPKISPAT